jgi:hypothetical protein
VKPVPAHALYQELCATGARFRTDNLVLPVDADNKESASPQVVHIAKAFDDCDFRMNGVFLVPASSTACADGISGFREQFVSQEQLRHVILCIVTMLEHHLRLFVLPRRVVYWCANGKYENGKRAMHVLKRASLDRRLMTLWSCRLSTNAGSRCLVFLIEIVGEHIWPLHCAFKPLVHKRDRFGRLAQKYKRYGALWTFRTHKTCSQIC